MKWRAYSRMPQWVRLSEWLGVSVMTYRRFGKCLDNLAVKIREREPSCRPLRFGFNHHFTVVFDSATVLFKMGQVIGRRYYPMAIPMFPVSPHGFRCRLPTVAKRYP